MSFHTLYINTCTIIFLNFLMKIENFLSLFVSKFVKVLLKMSTKYRRKNPIFQIISLKLKLHKQKITLLQKFGDFLLKIDHFLNLFLRNIYILANFSNQDLQRNILEKIIVLHNCCINHCPEQFNSGHLPIDPRQCALNS